MDTASLDYDREKFEAAARKLAEKHAMRIQFCGSLWLLVREEGWKMICFAGEEEDPPRFASQELWALITLARSISFQLAGFDDDEVESKRDFVRKAWQSFKNDDEIGKRPGKDVHQPQALEKGQGRYFVIRAGRHPGMALYTRAPSKEYALTELWLLAEKALQQQPEDTAIGAYADIDPSFRKQDFEKSYRETGRIQLFFNRLAKVKNGEFPWKAEGGLDETAGAKRG